MGPDDDDRIPAGALRLAIRGYAEQLRLDRGRAALALILPGLGNALAFYGPPLVVGRLVVALMNGDRSWNELWPYVAVIAAVWTLGELCARVGVHFMIAIEARGINRLYSSAMDSMLAKDLAFFHDNFAGALTHRVTRYARAFEQVFDTLCFQVAGNLVPLLLAAVVLWRYSPVLVAAQLGMIGLTAVAVIPLIRKRSHLVRHREEQANSVSGHVADVMANIDAVRAFAREPYEASRHRGHVDQYTASAARSWHYGNSRVNLVLSPMYVLTNVLGLVVALGLGQGRLGVDGVVVAFTYFAQSTRVLWDFNIVYRNLETALTEAAQFTALLSPPKVRDADAPAPLAPRDTSVRFVNVTYRHGGEPTPLFRQLDLTIAAGERVGLVGHSGGGKSTIARLLQRFSDVQEGRIEIGGQSIAEVSQSELRELIAYVPQDPVMFHRSVRDNIAYGRLDASADEIEAAARSAHAHRFIEQLPAGYDTLIGERGVKLSGGQRQRVAIARAVLRDAPILVLDEATSALDSASEALIQDALWTLLQGRTAIVIAHRLSTVARVDRLIVLHEGRPIEEGTHHELLARGGTYAELWAHQSGGFIDGQDELATAIG